MDLGHSNLRGGLIGLALLTAAPASAAAEGSFFEKLRDLFFPKTYELCATQDTEPNTATRYCNPGIDSNCKCFTQDHEFKTATSGTVEAHLRLKADGDKKEIEAVPIAASDSSLGGTALRESEDDVFLFTPDGDSGDDTPGSARSTYVLPGTTKWRDVGNDTPPSPPTPLVERLVKLFSGTKTPSPSAGRRRVTVPPRTRGRTLPDGQVRSQARKNSATEAGFVPYCESCQTDQDRIRGTQEQFAEIKTAVERFPQAAYQRALNCLRKYPEHFPNKRCLTINDYTQPVTFKRQFEICSKAGNLLADGEAPLITQRHVAHGSGRGSRRSTGELRPVISDAPGRHHTSAGFFRTDPDLTRSQWGTANAGLCLTGLETRNQNAARRTIKIHGAQGRPKGRRRSSDVYWKVVTVEPNDFDPYAKVFVHTEGCPAVDDDQFLAHADAMKGGALLYHYTDEDAKASPECPDFLSRQLQQKRACSGTVRPRRRAPTVRGASRSPQPLNESPIVSKMAKSA